MLKQSNPGEACVKFLSDRGAGGCPDLEIHRHHRQPGNILRTVQQCSHVLHAQLAHPSAIHIYDTVAFYDYRLVSVDIIRDSGERVKYHMGLVCVK